MMLQQVYLDDVNKFYAEHITYEGDSDQNLVTDWDHMWWAANVLLAEATDQGTFHQAVQVSCPAATCTALYVPLIWCVSYVTTPCLASAFQQALHC